MKKLIFCIAMLLLTASSHATEPTRDAPLIVESPSLWEQFVTLWHEVNGDYNY